MSNVVTSLKKGWHFVTHRLWEIRLDKVNPRLRIALKSLRIFSLSVKGFNEDNCLLKATALTFYTLFSIVPIIALVFAFAKAFGDQEELEGKILNNYNEYRDVLEHALASANKLLDTTKGGLIAGVGIILLLWSVMNLLINIENSFNEIWEIKKGRTWYRKITDYLTLMIVAPIFLLISGSITVLIQTHVVDFIFTGAAPVILKLVAMLMLALVFTVLYLVLPNTKVSFKSAFFGALLATVLFEVLQWAYLAFQIGASKYNAIYGSFAALPLFLLWVQYSWYIVLFGAELSFAHQNVDHYELENEIKSISVRYKRVIALLLCRMVVRNFDEGKKAMTAVQLAHALDLPVRLSRTLINEMVETKIFAEVKTAEEKETAYQPAISDSKLTVKYVIDKLDEKGVNALPISDSEELSTINRLMIDMDQVLNNDKGNILVKDIR